MRFDASRLAVLAGLSGERSGLLREGVHPEGDENLDIMGEEEGDEGYGHMSEAEGDEGYGQMHEEEEGEGEGDEEADAEAMAQGEKAVKAASAKAAADVEGKDESIRESYVTVDEDMLRREIMRMKQQQLAENKVRMAVRKEIESILSEDYDDDDLYLTSSWLYGSNKPRNSRKGGVHTAIPGLGFAPPKS